MKTFGKAAALYNNVKLELDDNMTFVLDDELRFEQLNHNLNYNCTFTLDDDNVNKLEELINYLRKLDKQKELKEKILRRLIMKLVNKKIKGIETYRYIMILDPFENNKIIYVDKTKFKTKDDFIPLFNDEELKLNDKRMYPLL